MGNIFKWLPPRFHIKCFWGFICTTSSPGLCSPHGYIQYAYQSLACRASLQEDALGLCCSSCETNLSRKALPGALTSPPTKMLQGSQCQEFICFGHPRKFLLFCLDLYLQPQFNLTVHKCVTCLTLSARHLTGERARRGAAAAKDDCISVASLLLVNKWFFTVSFY